MTNNQFLDLKQEMTEERSRLLRLHFMIGKLPSSSGMKTIDIDRATTEEIYETIRDNLVYLKWRLEDIFAHHEKEESELQLLRKQRRLIRMFLGVDQ